MHRTSVRNIKNVKGARAHPDAGHHTQILERVETTEQTPLPIDGESSRHVGDLARTPRGQHATHMLQPSSMVWAEHPSCRLYQKSIPKHILSYVSSCLKVVATQWQLQTVSNSTMNTT